MSPVSNWVKRLSSIFLELEDGFRSLNGCDGSSRDAKRFSVLVGVTA